MTAAESAALRAFVSTINNTGGVVRFADGKVAPVEDMDWTDLGAAYIDACNALAIGAHVTNAAPDSVPCPICQQYELEWRDGKLYCRNCADFVRAVQL